MISNIFLALNRLHRVSGNFKFIKSIVFLIILIILLLYEVYPIINGLRRISNPKN